MRRIGFLALLLLTLVAGVQPAAAGSITTIPQQSGVASPWGEPASGGTPTYGQSFTASSGLGLFLDSVTFEINNPTASNIDYTALLYQWTGSAIVGPALFTSGPLSVAPTSGALHQVTVSFAGSSALTNGQTYVALFSTIGKPGTIDSASWGLAPLAAYSGGKFVYNNSSTLGGLFAPASPAWNQFGDFGNTAFTMSFTDTSAAPNVPEPATLTLVGLGLSTLGRRAWRKHTAKR